MSQDTTYVFGIDCTWHDTAANAGVSRFGTTEVPCCPKCASLLNQLASSGEFWSMVRRHAQADPANDYEGMMRWSQGMCFPDVDTLTNAYRQAMEGTR